MGGEKLWRVTDFETLKIIRNEVSLAKQIIMERKTPFDLLRELISNSAAKEVGTKEIRISYFMTDLGHAFRVEDDGCGMDLTKDITNPGRLDKFLGLGLSQIVGITSDEFGYKGIGSKLAYQSRRVEIETFTGEGDMTRVRIEEPWETIERASLPNPKIWSDSPDRSAGTVITVYGYPPHVSEEPYPKAEIVNYLRHRTFVGFTKQRNPRPRIFFSYMGDEEEIDFGFPELSYMSLDDKNGLVVVNQAPVSSRVPGKSSSVRVKVKGFYTWDGSDYGLSTKKHNTGLILSVKGIPYCNLSFVEDAESAVLFRATPGETNCCLIVECDEVSDVMNIARTALVDDAKTDVFRKVLQKRVRDIEFSQDMKEFRKVRDARKEEKTASDLDSTVKQLGDNNQLYAVYQEKVLLGVQPKSASDLRSILTKLEVLEGLPFDKFQILHQADNGSLIANFREGTDGEIESYVPIETERVFTNYLLHKHPTIENRKVICWDLGVRPRIRIDNTKIPWKVKAYAEGGETITVYLVKNMPGVSVKAKRLLKDLL